MITRKAILAAFEVIVNNKAIRSVTIFVGTERIFRKIERVRVTRTYPHKQEFRVNLGLCNYAEKEVLKSASRSGKPLPKVITSGWPKRKKAA